MGDPHYFHSTWEASGTRTLWVHLWRHLRASRAHPWGHMSYHLLPIHIIHIDFYEWNKSKGDGYFPLAGSWSSGWEMNRIDQECWPHVSINEFLIEFVTRTARWVMSSQKLPVWFSWKSSVWIGYWKKGQAKHQFSWSKKRSSWTEM